MTTKTEPDWEAFGKEVMECWPESLEIDCFTIQELAWRDKRIKELRLELINKKEILMEDITDEEYDFVEANS